MYCYFTVLIYSFKNPQNNGKIKFEVLSTIITDLILMIETVVLYSSNFLTFSSDLNYSKLTVCMFWKSIFILRTYY